MSPELIEAIKDIGALGFAIIAVWAFATGRVRPGPLVDRDMEHERNRANRAEDRLERFLNIIEDKTESK